MGEELLRSSVAKGLVGADGVVGPLPVLEFLVERGDLERAGGDLIEFLRVRTLGAFDRAVELGRAGRQDKELQAALLPSVFEGGGELTAAVDLHRADREGQALLQGVEKAGGRRGRGPAVGLDHVPARDHVARGELLEDHARHRAHLQGVDLDQIAGPLHRPVARLADGIRPRPGTGARRTIPIRSRLDPAPRSIDPDAPRPYQRRRRACRIFGVSPCRRLTMSHPD